MHNALRQTQIELAAIDFAFAVGHRIHWAVVEENQIQIRAVAQFPSAQFAVADNREATAMTLAQMRRLAVTRHHLHPRLLNNRINHRFRKPCEMVAHLHHRQRSGDIRRRNV